MARPNAPNLLVYAHRADSSWHAAAFDRMVQLAEGRTPWVIPWPCIREFLTIVTHPRIYSPPTPLEKAIDQVEAWLESPSLVLISESEEYWPELRTILQPDGCAALRFMMHGLLLCANSTACPSYGRPTGTSTDSRA